MQTNIRTTPARVYLHPASGFTPDDIHRVQRDTGMLVVFDASHHAVRLIPMAAAGDRAVSA